MAREKYKEKEGIKTEPHNVDKWHNQALGCLISYDL